MAAYWEVSHDTTALGVGQACGARRSRRVKFRISCGFEQSNSSKILLIEAAFTPRSGGRRWQVGCAGQFSEYVPSSFSGRNFVFRGNAKPVT
jgi:hypothetical protein